MSPRQRVLKALSHQAPDRVPIDFGGFQTGIHKDAYRRVVKPRQKALVQHIKSLTRAKIWYHTCGSCIEYIPDLPTAEPDDVRQQVRRNMEILKPGGGYVFNSIHNIQPGVPPENIVALFDAAYEYGFYV